MPAASSIEQQIVEALQRVSSSRWAEVLEFVRSLEGQEDEPRTSTLIVTGRDLAQSDVVGLWAERTDLGDGHEFARRLRDQAERRGGVVDAPGH